MKKSIAQTNIYQAKRAVDQALAELKWGLHQKIEFEFQQYLSEVLFKVLPPPMVDGVKPDIFQSRSDGSGRFQSRSGKAGAAPSNHSQQWLIFVRSPELAHQLHFLSPEVERRLQQLLEQRDRRSIPLRIRYRLRQLRCKKITIRAVLRPQLWQEYLPQPRRALAAMFDRHKPDAAEAARIINDFVNAAPAELLAPLKKPQYPI